MKQVLVKYDDYDKKGIRKNGEKLPLSGGIRNHIVGFKDSVALEFLDSEKNGIISGVVLIFEDAAEKRKYQDFFKKDIQ